MRPVIAVAFVALVMVASCKKTQSAEPVLTKCKSDAECVYVAKDRGDCCVNPCGGMTKPVHQDEAAAISRYNIDYCTTERQQACPQAGACGQPPAPPPPIKCENGACVAGK